MRSAELLLSAQCDGAGAAAGQSRDDELERDRARQDLECHSCTVHAQLGGHSPHELLLESELSLAHVAPSRARELVVVGYLALGAHRDDDVALV